jgi:hypothetical protein
MSGGRYCLSERGQTLICLPNNGELKMENGESVPQKKSLPAKQNATAEASLISDGPRRNFNL